MSSSGSGWVHNSYKQGPISHRSMGFVHFSLAVSLLILIHSWRHNGSAHSTTRKLVDIGALCTAAACVCCYADFAAPTAFNEAFIMDLVFYGVLATVNQLTDNYFMYWRYVALQKPAPWVCLSIQAYICVILVLSYLPFYTVLPFTVDLNSRSNRLYLIGMVAVSQGGYLLFNLFFMVAFSIHVWRALKAASRLSALTSGHEKAVAYASRIVLRVVFSSIGVCLRAMEGPLRIHPVGTLACMLLVILSTHLLFNCPVNELFVRLRRSLVKGRRMTLGVTAAAANNAALVYKVNMHAAKRGEKDLQAMSRKLQQGFDEADTKKLEDIIQEPMLRDLFVEYCRSCFCEESCLFLLEVNRFKQAAVGARSKQRLAEVASLCSAILHEYVKPGSVFEVNISSAQRHEAIARATAFMEHCTTFARRPSLHKVPTSKGGTGMAAQASRKRLFPVVMPQDDNDFSPSTTPTAASPITTPPAASSSPTEPPFIRLSAVTAPVGDTATDPTSSSSAQQEGEAVTWTPTWPPVTQSTLSSADVTQQAVQPPQRRSQMPRESVLSTLHEERHSMSGEDSPPHRDSGGSVPASTSSVPADEDASVAAAEAGRPPSSRPPPIDPLPPPSTSDASAPALPATEHVTPPTEISVPAASLLAKEDIPSATTGPVAPSPVSPVGAAEASASSPSPVTAPPMAAEASASSAPPLSTAEAAPPPRIRVLRKHGSLVDLIGGASKVAPELEAGVQGRGSRVGAVGRGSVADGEGGGGGSGGVGEFGGGGMERRSYAAGAGGGRASEPLTGRAQVSTEAVDRRRRSKAKLMSAARVALIQAEAAGASARRGSADVTGDWNAGEEAATVYRTAYGEISSMLEKNVLTPFKTTWRYKALGNLSALTNDAPSKR